jgi:hypothetical protein
MRAFAATDNAAAASWDRLHQVKPRPQSLLSFWCWTRVQTKIILPEPTAERQSITHLPIITKPDVASAYDIP